MENLGRNVVSVVLGLAVVGGAVLVFSDVPTVAKVVIPVAVLAVVVFRLREGSVAIVLGIGIGMLAFPILALAAVAAGMDLAKIERLDPEFSWPLGVAVVFFAAWAYLSPRWARNEGISGAWRWAGLFACVTMVIPPFAIFAYDRIRGSERVVEEKIAAVSKLDVIVLRERPGGGEQSVPETRGWQVNTWVGQVDGDKVTWDAKGAPPLTPPDDADRVLLLMVDGAPERLDNAAELPDVDPADEEEVARWMRIADSVATEATPTFAILQTTVFERIDDWRKGLEDRNGEAVSLQERAGDRSMTDLALQLAVDAPTAAQDLVLAARHRPHLFFDGQERYRHPLNIDRVIKSGKLRICGGQQPIPGFCPPVDENADIHNGASHFAFETSELARETADSTMYVNVTRSGNDHPNTVYLDYWWYLPDNPSGAVGGAFCGVGFVIAGTTCLDHQSDWEGVTVIVNADSEETTPTAVSYAQHNLVKRYRWEVLQQIWDEDERWRYAGNVDASERPLVFVARGTHASYPKRCARRSCPIDHAHGPEERHDGERRWPSDDGNCPTTCVLAFPTRGKGGGLARWNAFAGEWGSAKCVIGNVCTQSSPPRSPGHQARFKHPWCEDYAYKLVDARRVPDTVKCGGRKPSASELRKGERLLALGDSFSSGQGAGDYEAGTNGGGNTCYRSTAAWPLRLARRLNLTALESLACSGGLIDDIRIGRADTDEQERSQSQLKRISDDPSVITLTIGGNDAGFARVLRSCVTGDCLRAYNKPSGDLLQAKVARVGQRLPRLYREIREKAPRARLVVVGYPRLFPASGAEIGNCAALARISVAEADYLNGALDALNAAVATAAKEAAVDFVDVTDAFDEHELRCGDQSYMNPLRLPLRTFPASFHPTAKGHARLAEVIAERLPKTAPLAAPGPG